MRSQLPQLGVGFQSRFHGVSGEQRRSRPWLDFERVNCIDSCYLLACLQPVPSSFFVAAQEEPGEWVDQRGRRPVVLWWRPGSWTDLGEVQVHGRVQAPTRQGSCMRRSGDQAVVSWQQDVRPQLLSDEARHSDSKTWSWYQIGLMSRAAPTDDLCKWGKSPME